MLKITLMVHQKNVVAAIQQNQNICLTNVFAVRGITGALGEKEMVVMHNKCHGEESANAVMDLKGLQTNVEAEIIKKQKTCQINIRGDLGQLGTAEMDVINKKYIGQENANAKMEALGPLVTVVEEIQRSLRNYQINAPPLQNHMNQHQNHTILGLEDTVMVQKNIIEREILKINIVVKKSIYY